MTAVPALVAAPPFTVNVALFASRVTSAAFAAAFPVVAAAIDPLARFTLNARFCPWAVMLNLPVYSSVSPGTSLTAAMSATVVAAPLVCVIFQTGAAASCSTFSWPADSLPERRSRSIS